MATPTPSAAAPALEILLERCVQTRLTPRGHSVCLVDPATGECAIILDAVTAEIAEIESRKLERILANVIGTAIQEYLR